MATLYYAEHVHITQTQTGIPIPCLCIGPEPESISKSISGNVNEPTEVLYWFEARFFAQNFWNFFVRGEKDHFCQVKHAR